MKRMLSKVLTWKVADKSRGKIRFPFNYTHHRKDEEMLARLSRSLSRATEFNVRQEEVIDELWLILYC